MAPLLSSAFVTENHAFFGATLTGVSAQRDRWKRGLQAVSAALGDALGKIYVAEYFPPRSKEFMLGVVANLVEAYRQSIQTLDWMGEETKQRALQKLELFHPKIGYPDNWRDYDAVVISRDDLVGNVQRAESASNDRDLRKLGGPVDRGEWFLSPQTVNAYYNVGMNDIVFPAAILQPPMFDVDADLAINYGAIGAVIGHEIGHGFDDQGAKYNGTGNLEDWWTDSDRVAFEERSAKLIAQFDAIQPEQLTGQHVNGALTVGENIGDLGGLTIAHRAYLNSLGGAAAPVIDGLTGSQRFFISWARIWRGKIRDAELARRLVVDPHAPDEFRCNTITPNLDEFCEAFSVSAGDGMWLAPASRVRIW
jgi:putative endopeptidase